MPCPAAELIADRDGAPASRCRIEHETIDSRGNPRTYYGGCVGDYTTCPTWREAREQHWANQGVQFAREISRDARGAS